MITLILAAATAPPPRMPNREALEHRLALVQAQIDRTMDLEHVRALNAEYGRLQRQLDERDMRVIRKTSEGLR